MHYETILKKNIFFQLLRSYILVYFSLCNNKQDE